MRLLTKLAAPAAALALLVPACSDGGTVEVEDAWARSPMQDIGAVYFTVTNDGDEQDRLVSARAEIAGRAEVHETVMEDGQAEMRPVDAVAIPAGDTIAFESGGHHVMLFDLADALVVGETISVVLTFEEAGEIQVEAEVRAFVEDEMDDAEM